MQQQQETQQLDVFVCSLCKSCKGAWDKKMYCPICIGAYSKDGAEPLVCCEECERYAISLYADHPSNGSLKKRRWIHVECDPSLSMSAYEELVASPNPKFTCVLCAEPKRRDRFGNATAGKYSKGRVMVEAHGNIIFAPPNDVKVL